MKHSKEHSFAFPVVKDADNRIADLYGARVTPEPGEDLADYARFRQSFDTENGDNAFAYMLAAVPEPSATLGRAHARRLRGRGKAAVAAYGIADTGYTIPAEGVILMPQWIVHRYARWWPEPERFLP